VEAEAAEELGSDVASDSGDAGSDEELPSASDLSKKVAETKTQIKAKKAAAAKRKKETSAKVAIKVKLAEQTASKKVAQARKKAQA